MKDRKLFTTLAAGTAIAALGFLAADSPVIANQSLDNQPPDPSNPLVTPPPTETPALTKTETPPAPASPSETALPTQTYTQIEKTSTPTETLLPEKEIKVKGNLIFSRYVGGNWEVIRKDESGKEQNLTDHPADDMNAIVSPEGENIIFASNRDGNQVGNNFEIILQNLKTGKVENLTEDEARDWDPYPLENRKGYVFNSTKADGYGDIFLVNYDPNETINLTEDMSDTEEWRPVPGNGRIYFTSGVNEEAELWVMDMDGTNKQKLTENDCPDWYPSINPATGKLVFISKDPQNPYGPDKLFTMNPDGSGRMMLPGQPTEGANDDPTWSPDGNLLAFINNASGQYDIYTINADGTNLTRITSTPEDELSPVFAP